MKQLTFLLFLALFMNTHSFADSTSEEEGGREEEEEVARVI